MFQIITQNRNHVMLKNRIAQTFYVFLFFFLIQPGTSMAKEPYFGVSKPPKGSYPILPFTEELAVSTVQIQVELNKDNATGTGTDYFTGTGFFFSFFMEDKENIPVIVTNKHVVAGAKKGSFILTNTNDDGTPNTTSHILVSLDSFESRWIAHPDSTIDLAIMPIAPLINEVVSKGFTPFFRTLNKSLIPTDEQLKRLTTVEDIVMVGYPTGISDRYNNYPIFRKGITATHPANKYEGRDEFMIDAACFPGSSGSPVFLLNIGSFVDRRYGGLLLGDRFYFLGILYAGPQYTATGEIKIVTIPDRQGTLTQTYIPINLGNVIRSSKLIDFENVLKQIINKQEQPLVK